MMYRIGRGRFMLIKKTYGIDLGSSNIIKVCCLSGEKQKPILRKHDCVKGHTIIAMGNEAYDMFEKSHVDIVLIRRWHLV